MYSKERIDNMEIPGYWFIHYPKKESVDTLVSGNIGEAKEWVTAKCNGIEPKIVRLEFHDGSYIRKVYKNLYVAFNYEGKQCELFFADDNDTVEIHDCEILFNRLDQDCFCYNRSVYENGIELYYKEIAP